jgi:uncharacterized protein (TIGR02284 family)
MTVDEQLQILQNLMIEAKESVVGYWNAAEKVADVRLAAAYARCARERASFVADLASEVVRVIGEIPRHRGAVNAKRLQPIA